MNLYRGCTHGCIYCDARSLCYHTPIPFEDIEVKQNAPELLAAALTKKRKRCMIGTGSMSDPYLHAEEKLLLTRRCLNCLDLPFSEGDTPNQQKLSPSVINSFCFYNVYIY